MARIGPAAFESSGRSTRGRASFAYLANGVGDLRLNLKPSRIVEHAAILKKGEEGADSLTLIRWRIQRYAEERNSEAG
jgi:hypothetical protein